VVSKVYADEQVKVVQHQRPEHKPAQDVELSAPAMDFLVSSGKRLTRAETIGSPEISVTATDDKAGSTHVTADKFIASFDSLGRLSQVHGEPNARVVTTPAFEASQANDGAGRATRQSPDSDRISTSNSIDAYFRPGTGIEVLLQRGNFHYSAGTQQAFADTARYTPANQIADLSGSPRIVDTGMETTARTVRLNRATGDGFADGDVKTTYSDLKPQPDGALLASSDPIHVTAQHMTAHKNPASAIYTGNARLWQSANVVEAPSIQFRKDQRLLVADSSSKQKVSTTLIGTNKSGKATPIAVTADHLTYRDSERIAHFEGGVRVNSADLTITSERMDVYLLRAAEARAPSPGQTAPAYRPATFQVDAGAAAGATQPHSQAQTLAKLDKIVASGSVVITEPNRRATGDQLTYTASDDTFVLSGGPPCIFDAEHGKITGVSLTFYRTDDRVVVEGDSSSPAITRTRVVR
jgi:lipopolysaccharide export system protein LptA